MQVNNPRVAMLLPSDNAGRYDWVLRAENGDT
jgi:uncharacterized protein YegP (UPF0339 family)